MSLRIVGKLAAGLALAVLLVAGPGGLRGDQDQKTPPNKEGDKNANSWPWRQ
jgi:hypothetical protein